MAITVGEHAGHEGEACSPQGESAHRHVESAPNESGRALAEGEGATTKGEGAPTGGDAALTDGEGVLAEGEHAPDEGGDAPHDGDGARLLVSGPPSVGGHDREERSSPHTAAAARTRFGEVSARPTQPGPAPAARLASGKILELPPGSGVAVFLGGDTKRPQKEREIDMSRKNLKTKILPQTIGETEDCLANLLGGIKTHMPADATWTIAGVPFSKKGLEKIVSEHLGAFTAPHEAEAAFHRLNRERDARAPATATFLADMLVALENQLGRTNEKLEEFGFRPRKKPADRTASEKAAQVALSLQTKEKNGTIGPRAAQDKKPA